MQPTWHFYAQAAYNGRAILIGKLQQGSKLKMKRSIDVAQIPLPIMKGEINCDVCTSKTMRKKMCEDGLESFIAKNPVARENSILKLVQGYVKKEIEHVSKLDRKNTLKSSAERMNLSYIW